MCHGSELVLVSGQDELLLDELERELSAQVQSYLTNFARHGNPNPGANGTAVEGMIEWPPPVRSLETARCDRAAKPTNGRRMLGNGEVARMVLVHRVS